MTTKLQILVEHDQLTDTTYYRENPPHNGTRRVVGVDLGSIDWLDLAKRKQALLVAAWPTRADPVWGLIAFIDHIQDAADAAGLPVVWAAGEGDEVHVPARAE